MCSWQENLGKRPGAKGSTYQFKQRSFLWSFYNLVTCFSLFHTLSRHHNVLLRDFPAAVLLMPIWTTFEAYLETGLTKGVKEHLGVQAPGGGGGGKSLGGYHKLVSVDQFSKVQDLREAVEHHREAVEAGDFQQARCRCTGREH